MKNAIKNLVGMLGDIFVWLVANLKQGVIYFIKQTCGNEIMPSVYLLQLFNVKIQMRFKKETGYIVVSTHT